ncbi:DUF3945 domain-containing protein [Persicobacter diffluens]|uniref:DUF3945 domain-containing protein n=1 Tax=Persicobacter diffluens TaxID=981 RepID=A0AAN4W515_9BACT|nr:hypothetical protein PEDI_52470 [Persicobacter diffluens]
MEERKNIFARIEDTIRSYFNPEFPVVPKLRNELGIDPVFNFKGSNDRVKGVTKVGNVALSEVQKKALLSGSGVWVKGVDSSLGKLDVKLQHSSISKITGTILSEINPLEPNKFASRLTEFGRVYIQSPEDYFMDGEGIRKGYPSFRPIDFQYLSVINDADNMIIDHRINHAIEGLFKDLGIRDTVEDQQKTGKVQLTDDQQEALKSGHKVILKGIDTSFDKFDVMIQESKGRLEIRDLYVHDKFEFITKLEDYMRSFNLSKESETLERSKDSPNFWYVQYFLDNSDFRISTQEKRFNPKSIKEIGDFTEIERIERESISQKVLENSALGLIDVGRNYFNAGNSMEVWGITSKAERPYDFIQAVKDHQLHQKGVNVDQISISAEAINREMIRLQERLDLHAIQRLHKDLEMKTILSGYSTGEKRAIVEKLDQELKDGYEVNFSNVDTAFGKVNFSVVDDSFKRYVSKFDFQNPVEAKEKIQQYQKEYQSDQRTPYLLEKEVVSRFEAGILYIDSSIERFQKNQQSTKVESAYKDLERSIIQNAQVSSSTAKTDISQILGRGM